MKRKWGLGISICLAGSLLLSGCGAKPAASGDAGTSSNQNANASKSAGTINISLDADPPKLDPTNSSALVERIVLQSIFDPLVEIDSNGNVVPMLVEKWELSDDNKTYTFHLRQGVKFHDGTDFDAEAVKFNLERNMEKGSLRKGDLAEVSKVIVVDAHTVKMELSNPFAPILANLAGRAGMIVSPTAVKKYGEEFLNNPVGTGPFVYKERSKGTSVTLEKNPNYWQQGLPKVDKVVYKVINDTNVALMNLKSGQVDLTNKFPYKELENVKNDPNIGAINEPGYAYRGMYLNTKKPPFDNKELRQAVDLLIDREAITKVVLNGAGAPAHSPFAPAHFTYGDSDKAAKPDLEKVKELLKKAGKPDGFSFTLKTDPTPVYQQVGQMIQNMLKPAGIQVNLEKVEFGTLLDQSTKGNFDASVLGWSGSPDPDQQAYDAFVTNGPRNFSQYSNPEVDKLLTQARTEADQAKRKELYDQFMAIINDEIPYIYFYHENIVFGISKSVEGFQFVPDGVIRTVNLSKK